MSQLTAVDLVEAERDLARFQAPTLIVWGTDDVFFPLEQARRLAALIPGTAGVVELPGARLLHPLEHPQLIAGQLRWFWSHPATPPSPTDR